MKITIEDASEDFTRELVALAAQQQAELTITTIDTTWTVDRAERYLRSLPAGAYRFAEMVVVDGDGYIQADQLRGVLGKLNGPTVALSRAIPRGVREGWWPDGTTAPISPVWDPDNPSWHKNIAYQMSSENVGVFREALTRIVTARQTTGGPGKPVGTGTITAPGAHPVDLNDGSRPTGDDYDKEEQGNVSHLSPTRDHAPGG